MTKQYSRSYEPTIALADRDLEQSQFISGHVELEALTSGKEAEFPLSKCGAMYQRPLFVRQCGVPEGGRTSAADQKHHLGQSL